MLQKIAQLAFKVVNIWILAIFSYGSLIFKKLRGYVKCFTKFHTHVGIAAIQVKKNSPNWHTLLKL